MGALRFPGAGTPINDNLSFPRTKCLVCGHTVSTSTTFTYSNDRTHRFSLHCFSNARLYLFASEMKPKKNGVKKEDSVRR